MDFVTTATRCLLFCPRSQSRKHARHGSGRNNISISTASQTDIVCGGDDTSLDGTNSPGVPVALPPPVSSSSSSSSSYARASRWLRDANAGRFFSLPLPLVPVSTRDENAGVAKGSGLSRWLGSLKPADDEAFSTKRASLAADRICSISTNLAVASLPPPPTKCFQYAQL